MYAWELLSLAAESSQVESNIYEFAVLAAAMEPERDTLASDGLWRDYCPPITSCLYLRLLQMISPFRKTYFSQFHGWTTWGVLHLKTLRSFHKISEGLFLLGLI